MDRKKLEPVDHIAHWRHDVEPVGDLIPAYRIVVYLIDVDDEDGEEWMVRLTDAACDHLPGEPCPIEWTGTGTRVWIDEEGEAWR